MLSPAGTWPELKKEMEYYCQHSPAAEPLCRLYGEIFQAWFRCRERCAPALSWEDEEIEESLRQGRYLLAGRTLKIDAALFREVLAEIAGAVAGHCPEAAGVEKMVSLPELQGEGAARCLAEIASFDGAQLQEWLAAHGWSGRTGVDPELLAFVLFSSLAPFYICLAEAVAERTDFGLWREGYCPVCGRKPGMAKLREKDGARILECWLCHARWQFPRLQCPFCGNRDFDRLRFFYTNEYPGRRVQLCERCRNYLKTVVVKEIGRDVVLELENIFTADLDYLARREGYRAGEDLAVLS